MTLSRLPIVLPALLLLAACGTQGKAELAVAAAPAQMLAARLVPESPAVAMAPPRRGAVSPGTFALPTPSPAPGRPEGRPLDRVAAANRAAAREPRGDAYANAVQVYPWTPGALYRLYTAPERVSEIALEPGESLVSVAAGDTVRWVIGDTVSGAGTARRTHVLVKPTAAGLSTNLVIATDRRVYHLLLESSAGAAMASVSWSYPEDALLALERGGARAGDAVAGIDLDALEFGYALEGDDPPWRPLRAFDDGRQVFIEFPPSLAQGEAPPLFVSAADGGVELVNYRLRGRYYVVDRLFDAAELRLGEKRQRVVRIVRLWAEDSRERSGRR